MTPFLLICGAAFMPLHTTYRRLDVSCILTNQNNGSTPHAVSVVQCNESEMGFWFLIVHVCYCSASVRLSQGSLISNVPHDEVICFCNCV